MLLFLWTQGIVAHYTYTILNSFRARCVILATMSVRIYDIYIAIIYVRWKSRT